MPFDICFPVANSLEAT